MKLVAQAKVSVKVGDREKVPCKEVENKKAFYILGEGFTPHVLLSEIGATEIRLRL